MSTDCGSASTLYCEFCDFVQFSTYSEFHLHHLSHIRQPAVNLVKLNDSLIKKLKVACYKVNTGVARRSVNHVSPLKISLKKNQGTSQFQVIKKEKPGFGSNSPSYDHKSTFKLKTEGVKLKPEPKFDAGGKESKEVEGKNLLERFGANISITRKGAPVVPKIKEEPSKEDSDSNSSNSNDKSVAKSKAESLLERFQGIPGLSISKPKVSSTNGNSNDSTSSVSIASKPKSFDISQLKKLKDDSSEQDKKTIDNNKLLERLSGLGGISFAPKKVVKPESPKEKEKEESEEESKDEDDGNDSKEESQNVSKDESMEEESDQKSDVETTNNASKLSPKNGSQDGYESSDSKNNLSEESNTAQTEEKEKSDVETTEKVEPRKFIRVKNSLVNRRDFDQEKRAKIVETGPSTEEQESNLEIEKDGGESRESAVDILERLADNLNSSAGLNKQGENQGQSRLKLKIMEEANLPPSPTPSEQLHPDFIAPPSECGDSDSTVERDQQFSDSGNIQNENQADCSMMMTPPSSTHDSSEATAYNTGNNDDTNQSINYDEAPTINNEEGDHDQQDVSVSFSNEEQPTYWSDVRGAPNSLDQPQQDPLMTGDGSASNGEMGGSFLHNFLNDSQTSQNNIPAEGSEFMSLERLAHQGLEGQHQQQGFDPNAPDPNAPMEQLSQQLQRLPQPQGPQINVIPQHHMQAPQPPQLHPGMPVSPHNMSPHMSPQHMSPQPPQGYDPMGHMQPPMPPLYQGFNMYNQNYAPQAPQMPPRPPPMLQQMPQRIQPRPFQSMAAIPTRPQRPRAFPVKRQMVRLPGPEMTAPKVRRIESPQQRQQQLAPGVKLPTGSQVTITPPKKNIEANKVANVLASRGITVTPAANRQQQPNAARAQQQQQRTNNAVINLNSAISITPSSQNRTSGGFAVPGPRRNPIVNHNVERPQPCATVDLTLDDDPPQQVQRNRGAIGRFSCNQCGKIFTTSVALETHKASHRAAGALAFKCDKCTAQYPTSIGLQQHKLSFHKINKPAPDLAIPIVDLNHPGARDQLGKCGIYNFLPLSQLQHNSNGFFGIPIINLDSSKEKAVSNLNTLGAGNIFVLGKMKPLTPNR